MRADMHKIVVERERHGGTRKNRKWGKRLAFVPDHDYEDQPKFVSSGRRRQYAFNGKWLTDVLGPLEGFLRGNLGRPWDKVYSELRQGLDVRKVTGQHIFDHLRSMVKTDCWIGPDRKLYAGPRGLSVTGFCVHRINGLLCFVPRQSARARKKVRLLRQTIDEVKLDRCQSYKLIAGQWYFIAHEYVRAAIGESHLRWDVVERRQVMVTWRPHRVAITKRQCHREEVKWIRDRIAAWRLEVSRM